MTCSQLVRGSRKHIRGCSTLPPNWKMVGLGYWDEFPMVSALVFMITHQTLPTMSHDTRISSDHDFTKLLQP